MIKKYLLHAWALLAFVTFVHAEEKKKPGQIRNELSSAIARGDLEAVEQFIEGGADPNGKDRNRLTPYQVAKISGYGRIADFLVEHGADGSIAIPSGEVLTDNLLLRIVKKHSPGAAVSVSRDGKVLFEKGYGLADRDNKRQVGLGTKFRIGSVTKQFTAAAIKYAEDLLTDFRRHAFAVVADFDDNPSA